MKTEITFEHILSGKASEISTFFSDVHLFGKYHPYITSVQDLIQSNTKSKYFHIDEQVLLWGFIPMKPSYDVTVIEVSPNKHIQYQSNMAKGMFLLIDYTFIEDYTTNTVKIIEAIELIGFPVINSIVIGLLKKSHAEMIEGIRGALESK